MSPINNNRRTHAKYYERWLVVFTNQHSNPSNPMNTVRCPLSYFQLHLGVKLTHLRKTCTRTARWNRTRSLTLHQNIIYTSSTRNPRVKNQESRHCPNSTCAGFRLNNRIYWNVVWSRQSPEMHPRLHNFLVITATMSDSRYTPTVPFNVLWHFRN